MQRPIRILKMLLDPKSRAIMVGVSSNRRMLREHIRELYFRKADGTLASVRVTNRHLTKLATLGILQRIRRRVSSGSGQYIYKLDPMGTKQMRQDFAVYANKTATS